MAETADMLEDDYVVTINSTTTRNSQANAIVERAHQMIGNMVCTFFEDNPDLDEKDPFAGLLSAVAFETIATVHTTLQATPGQLVFGRDAILNMDFESDWATIKNRKQRLINQTMFARMRIEKHTRML
mmetsp:Transcript_36964/g.54259  ORF Transcript_36964/g.54259 Transcript_36964/m.54259 type:complete len:128 (-) Transcript_36964:28-411(-)